MTNDIPVFVITGVKDKMLERRMMAMGAAGYFQKPVDFDALRDRLAAYIDILAKPCRSWWLPAPIIGRRFDLIARIKSRLVTADCVLSSGECGGGFLVGAADPATSGRGFTADVGGSRCGKADIWLRIRCLFAIVARG